MGQVVHFGSGRPRKPRRRCDDLALQIDRLRCEAERRGFTALTYFLDIAATEALVQEQRSLEQHPAAETHFR